MEMWWLFTSLMRYPKEIFAGTWFAPVSWFFTFIVPILIIVNVPAHGMVKVFEPGLVVFTFAATVVLLWGSRTFFRYALQKYRSASRPDISYLSFPGSAWERPTPRALPCGL